MTFQKFVSANSIELMENLKKENSDLRSKLIMAISSIELMTRRIGYLENEVEEQLEFILNLVKEDTEVENAISSLKEQNEK